MSRTGNLVLVLLVAATATATDGIADPQPTSPSQPVVIEVTGSDFHWLDAGLGAAAALAVVLLTIGLLLSVRHSH